MLMLILLCHFACCLHGYFNTSHVNVNHSITFNASTSLVISIHLMLMLIKVRDFIHLRQNTYFNTSHVNVNQKYLLYYVLLFFISIHLMLMLILLGFLSLRYQYSYFNTSHVNVNRRIVYLKRRL